LLYKVERRPKERGKEMKKIQVVKEAVEIWNGKEYRITSAVIAKGDNK
jgi:hypothetical protein